MYLIKIDFICKPLLLIAFLGFSSSVIASEAQPFEGWFVDPYNPTRAIFVSQADPHTEALADLLEARTILAKAELAKIQEDMELSENKEFLNIDWISKLCHMGQRTGFSCGSVSLVSGNLITCNASQKNLIAIRDCGKTAIALRGKQLLQNGGDSGGPYFDGWEKAYEIISYAGDTMGVDISSLKHLNGFQLKTSR